MILENKVESKSGTGGFPLCPLGKANFKKRSSYITQPSDLILNAYKT